MYISIGTMTGAISAHCAEPEVTSILSTATMTTTPKKSTGAGRFQLCSRSEPLIETQMPMLDAENQETNWATTKNSTRIGSMVCSPRAMKSGTSVAVVMVFTARP